MPVLIAAASGRALAASARRAGFAPLVADFFGDQDTLAIADTHVRIAPSNEHGLEADALLAAFEQMAKSHGQAAAVCGTGFEDRPDLLDKIALRWTLLGNSPQTVRRVKDPIAFAELCARCGIAHPQTTRARPDDMVGWLIKRIGGAGGTHIRVSGEDAVDGEGFYFQRRVEGLPISALLLADGEHVMLLGFSTQWSAPTPGRPFRYGGAARPAPLNLNTAAALIESLQRLVTAIPLVGLNSADFLLDGEDFHLLEINPRPGATLDIFEPRDVSLFALHVAACEGRLPAAPPRYMDAAASAIVYADRDIAAIPALAWPDWTADRPAAGTAVRADAPLCTVFAAAREIDQARALVDCRGTAIRPLMRARLP